MNFTYTVTKPPDGQFGSRMKNNTWTGMVHMLQNQEVDIGILYINKLNIAMFSIKFDNFAISAIAAFSVTGARSQVVTFGYPIAVAYNSLFIKNHQALNLMAYFEPYLFTSWLFLGAFCLLTSIMFFSVVR